MFFKIKKEHKIRALFLLGFIILSTLLSSCASTSVIVLDESTTYPPSQSVEILLTTPEKPFKIISQRETKGSVGQALPELI